mmetsp:Transcript_43461/g.81037  ORF Transcript_43461/g.81037 Transcript_43461/m.81037 type:complete len:100 (-) Transcript_43461:204-503(-)
MSASRVTDLFESIFVRHRLTLMLVCVLSSFLGTPPEARALPQLNGVELLVPEDAPLTRERLLSHVRATKQTSGVMRSTRALEVADETDIPGEIDPMLSA